MPARVGYAHYHSTLAAMNGTRCVPLPARIEPLTCSNARDPGAVHCELISTRQWTGRLLNIDAGYWYKIVYHFDDRARFQFFKASADSTRMIQNRRLLHCDSRLACLRSFRTVKIRIAHLIC